MINIVHTYLEAWVQKDIETIKEVLTPGDFGIRTFHKETVFDLDKLEEVLLDSNVIHIDVENITQSGNIIQVNAIYKLIDHEEEIMIKFTLFNNRIFKVYEVIKDSRYRRIKCVISYDGSMCFGFQKQPSFTTVQGTLEDALFEITKEDITIHASGRTDRGVHAINQVFHFDTKSKINPATFYQVLNKYLPDWMEIKKSEEVDPTFHSRYDVKTKEYMYQINTKEFDVIKRNYEWYPGTFDKDVFIAEIQSVLGTHDFASFTTTNTTMRTVRTIYSVDFKEINGYLQVFIKGNGFLRYMVRNIIVAAMLIAKGSASYRMVDLLEAKDNNILKDIAPSSGLYLYNVVYYND